MKGRVIGKHSVMTRYAVEVEDGDFVVFDLEFGDVARGDLVSGDFDCLGFALLRNISRQQDIEVNFIELRTSARTALAFLRGAPEAAGSGAKRVVRALLGPNLRKVHRLAIGTRS